MLQVNSQVNFFQVFKLNIFSLDVNWASNIRSICSAGYEFHNYVPSYVSAFLKIYEMEYWKVSRESETLLENRLTHFSPMFYFYTPENVRKSNVFWHLHKGQKWNINKKILLSLKGVFHSSRARNWREYISPQLNYNYLHIVKTYGKTTFYLQKHNTIIKYNFNTLNLMNTYVANRHKKTYILFFYLQIFNLRRFFFPKVPKQSAW